ncbi:uncharacterized protein LOC126375949 [Pectinophora gossypiella]|uniref:uncharacterized protein LOC126375949 n=1 Tax=Pectinophora gossypiella TaxID=13191 RepID=UPI00214E8B92|nr:uncharacterized protein LOC126375949 [Pectinophora gossypiella]
MLKPIFTFTFVLLACSLTKCAKPQENNRDINNSDNMKMDMGSNMNMNDKMNQDDMKVDPLAVMADCNDTFRIEMSYLQALNDSGSFPDETDKTPKCFLRCVLENTMVASEDGIYNPVQTASVFAGERGGKVMDDLEEMATTCAARDESCKCERAYQFLKCLMEKEIEKYENTE